jgi:division protein CdvB (Snf7/Vps24/ESCRT-III family)
MAFLFGGARQASSNTARDYQRKAASSARAMEREISRMDAKEAGLQRELARCAKDSTLEATAVKAKEIVRLRAHRGRLTTVKGHMTGLAQQLQSVQATGRIQETMAETTQMLMSMNSRFDAGSVARMITEFERQNAHMQAKQELIDDALDSGFEADGEQDECNSAVVDVLTEAGLDAQARLMTHPRGLAPPQLSSDDADMAQRLERLRTG